MKNKAPFRAQLAMETRKLKRNRKLIWKGMGTSYNVTSKKNSNLNVITSICSSWLVVVYDTLQSANGSILDGKARLLHFQFRLDKRVHIKPIFILEFVVDTVYFFHIYSVNMAVHYEWTALRFPKSRVSIVVEGIFYIACYFKRISPMRSCF